MCIYESDEIKSTHNRTIRCTINMLWVMDLSVIMFNTSWQIYSIPKESKCTAVFLLTNNETQCFSLLCLSLRFMKSASSFILGKISLEKTSLILGSLILDLLNFHRHHNFLRIINKSIWILLMLNPYFLSLIYKQLILWLEWNFDV